jgi:hypothetical protein
LCLGDCFNTTIVPQPTEITQFIFGQPLRLGDAAPGCRLTVALGLDLVESELIVEVIEPDRFEKALR